MNAPATFPAGPCETRGCNTLCPSGVYYCPACVAERLASDIDIAEAECDRRVKAIARLREMLADEGKALQAAAARLGALRAQQVAA